MREGGGAPGPPQGRTRPLGALLLPPRGRATPAAPRGDSARAGGVAAFLNDVPADQWARRPPDS